LRENEESEPQHEETPSAQPLSTPFPTEAAPPSMTEAQAWLESLPESPLLIRKEQRRTAPGGQTW
jgi:hypothetical protein